jgi:uncharacterized membrane protein
MKLFHLQRDNPLLHNFRNKPDLADVIERNISAMAEFRRTEEAGKSVQDRVSDALTSFSGSMLFVYMHVAWFGIWIIINMGWLSIKPFDPFPFGLLTLIVSLEAIFLSTFVLISQNRAGEAADKRAALDLQINLLSEHEVTRLITMVAAIADHLGIDTANRHELSQLEKDVAPEQLLDEIEAKEIRKKK